MLLFLWEMHSSSIEFVEKVLGHSFYACPEIQKNRTGFVFWGERAEGKGELFQNPLFQNKYVQSPHRECN